MTKYGIHDGNTWELTPEKLAAIVDRYNKGLIGQEAGDFLETSGYAEMVYAAGYDFLGGIGAAKSNMRVLVSPELEVAAANLESVASKVKTLPKNALPESELDDLSLAAKGTGKGANVGSVVKNGNKTTYKNPAGNELTWVDQHPKNINRDIDNALGSSNVGKATEAKVADFVRNETEVTGFGQKVLKVNGEAAGDLDVVTKDAIIEVKASIKAIKEDQFNKVTDLSQEFFFNPDKKKVILYIDKLITSLSPENKAMLDNIKAKGVFIVNSLNELKEALK
jgi:hypothetical protein